LERLHLEDPDHRRFGQYARRWRGINDHYDDARANYNDARANYNDARANYNDARANCDDHRACWRVRPFRWNLGSARGDPCDRQ
jgi:hypothetical protein